MLFKATPTNEGVDRPKVHVDARWLELPFAHHFDHARLHRRSDAIRSLDRRKCGLEDVPRLSVGANCSCSAVFEEVSFLAEGFGERFKQGEIRNQRLYELQFKSLSALFSMIWRHASGLNRRPADYEFIRVKSQLSCFFSFLAVFRAIPRLLEPAGYSGKQMRLGPSSDKTADKTSGIQQVLRLGQVHDGSGCLWRAINKIFRSRSRFKADMGPTL